MTEREATTRNLDRERDWFFTKEVRETVLTPPELEAALPYPEWAPTYCVLQLVKDTGSASMEEEVAILKTLCTKPEMERVWRRLRKHDLKAGKDYSARLPQEVYLGLYGYCAAADGLTPSQRQKKTEQIQAQIATLTDLLQSFQLNQPSLRLWTDFELDNILGRGKALDRFMRQMCSPSISELLQRLSESLNQSPVGAHSLIHAKTKDNEITRFARHMAIYFEKSYGDRLPENISLMISSIFDKSVGVDYLRKNLDLTPEGGKFRLKDWQSFPGKTPSRI
ncbi:hypothetical protein [Microbulbifer sp. ALW1]|uniref:hypothetical protein n=1 Tax=Microbulbifer sp. (strain ALW1) TaxID=1516059 RepID=UPI001359BD29|nr:hypothetical protein [Microbulbifer sp. ALW1]